MQNIDQKTDIYIGKRHRLPIDNAGIYVKASEEKPEVKEGQAEFLPIKEINVVTEIIDSIATIKITQVFVNP
jgi:hypothetical protein